MLQTAQGVDTLQKPSAVEVRPLGACACAEVTMCVYDAVCQHICIQHHPQVHDGTTTPLNQFMKDPDSLITRVTWKDEQDKVRGVGMFLCVRMGIHLYGCAAG